eukprot:gene17322-biopygen1697
MVAHRRLQPRTCNVSPVADFGGLGGPAGGLADFWRTLADWGKCKSAGGLVTTPREGHNSSVSVQFSFLPLHARTTTASQAVSRLSVPVPFLADFLADFGGLRRTSGGLAGGLWRTGGLGSPVADLTTMLRGPFP